MWDETARLSELSWVRREGKYFCKGGWTGKLVICPSGNQIESVQQIIQSTQHELPQPVGAKRRQVPRSIPDRLGKQKYWIASTLPP
jgi:hypothetical protein